jgi:ribosomal protein S19E (S16A)
METVEQKIMDQVQKEPNGTVFFPEDFSEAGSSDGVRKALQRLDSKGFVKRVAQGIYVYPKINKYIGLVMPTAEEVAEAIVRRDRARTVPTGVSALNALGLSTQMPMNLVLLTDGSPREIKVGKRRIKFKKTTPRNLSAKGEISRLVIQALKTLGKGNVSQQDEEKIIDVLKNERHGDLIHDIGVAPEWIQQIMKKAL